MQKVPLADIPKQGSVELLIPHIVRTISALPTPAFISIDGPSGSGKSTLAKTLQKYFPEAQSLEVEEWAAGWNDLAGAVERLQNIIAELRSLKVDVASANAKSPTPTDAPTNTCSIYTSRWNWHTETWRKPELLKAAPQNFLTGCGSGALSADLNIWVETSENIRKRRVELRDSYNWGIHWDSWAAQEREIADRYKSREKADFILQS